MTQPQTTITKPADIVLKTPIPIVSTAGSTTAVPMAPNMYLTRKLPAKTSADRDGITSAEMISTGACMKQFE